MTPDLHSAVRRIHDVANQGTRGTPDSVAITDETGKPQTNEPSGLTGLLQIALFHGIQADPGQFATAPDASEAAFDETRILRAARTLGLRSRVHKGRSGDIPEAGLPALLPTLNGEFLVLARLERNADRTIRAVLVQNQQRDQPERLGAGQFESVYCGRLLLFARNPAPHATSSMKFGLSWFLPVILRYRRIFAEVVVASFFLQLFALVTPLFFQVVMDKVLVHKGYSTLDVLAFGFLLIAFFTAVIAKIRDYLFAHTCNRIDVELGATLFRHLLGLPLAWFESRQVGQIATRIRELETIRNFLAGSALTLIIDLSFTLIFFAVMWGYSPTLTLIVAASLPFYAALSLVVTPVLRQRLENRYQAAAQNQGLMVESINGIQTVKSMAIEAGLQERWEQGLAEYVKASFRCRTLSDTGSHLAALFNRLSTLALVWWGAHLVMSGKLSVGQLVAFNMLAGQVSAPVLKLTGLWQEFQQAGLSIRRLAEILNHPVEPGFHPGRSRPPRLQGCIRFEQVNFRYSQSGNDILKNINLTIEAGEIVGIVGRSGSGKSTLTRLVQRLYVPVSGRILIDGADLAMLDTGWLRRNTGTVVQENFLFSGTIRENIALSRPRTTMEAIEKASRLAGAHEFILDLEAGYDTRVGEHGCNLSGGQRQRIAIARALLGDPRILLFDEATSALDNESERIVQQNLAAICSNRTVILVAHRLSTVRHCNRILVMQRGQIIESGTHQQLLDLHGHYADLHASQLNPTSKAGSQSGNRLREPAPPAEQAPQHLRHGSGKTAN